MERLTREMTFEEEYIILQKEVKELFDKEDKESEPPESHSVVRRALRCIKKLVAEVEPYKAYKDLEEQGLLLRLPCKVGAIVYRIINQRDNYDDTVYQIVSSTIFELSMIDKIGKTVFLTQAEAEQKLKEMNTNNGITE